MPNQPSTLAPSEKHLEDWIAANPSRLKSRDLPPLLDGLIDRQVRCQDGIIDLLGYKEHRIQVVELKKGEVDGIALAQLLRYMKDVRSVFDSVGVDLHYVSHQTSRCYGFTYEGVQFVQGILVGHSVERNTYFACYEAGVQVVLYSYANGIYSFDVAVHSGLYDEDKSPALQELRSLFEQFILRYDQDQMKGADNE